MQSQKNPKVSTDYLNTLVYLLFTKENSFSLAKKNRIHTTDSAKQPERSVPCTVDDMQSMTAYEYYVQCRAKSEEVRRKRLSRKMRGPISKKRMRALHALTTRRTNGRKLLFHDRLSFILDQNFIVGLKEAQTV